MDKCKIDEHIPKDNGEECLCGYFVKNVNYDNPPKPTPTHQPQDVEEIRNQIKVWANNHNLLVYILPHLDSLTKLLLDARKDEVKRRREVLKELLKDQYEFGTGDHQSYNDALNAVLNKDADRLSQLESEDGDE